ncbi:MAG: NAD(P)-dependent oxidoreductase [Alphaproteobacteria bacterium]|nr:NAD(P)-dependent oxidoreductase [Alphaproteobacteria bacterium]
MKSLLITGATGFIGTQVVSGLLARGYEVHSLVCPPFAPEQKNLIQHQMNLMDSAAVDAFLAANPFETLIHLAWYVGPKCQTSDANIDWLEASLHLIKSFHRNGGKTVLVTGSMSEYDFSYGWCRENETPLSSLSLYGQTKAALYETLNKVSSFTDLELKWARLFNLYGPREKPTRLMPSVINSMLKGEDVTVSPCTQTQNYLYVADAAEAIVAFLESDVTGAVNIVSDTAVRLRDVVEKIKELIGFRGNVLYGAIPAAFEQQFLSGDNTRLTKEIGWHQKTSLEDGLKKTIQWWKEQNV